MTHEIAPDGPRETVVATAVDGPEAKKSTEPENAEKAVAELPVADLPSQTALHDAPVGGEVQGAELPGESKEPAAVSKEEVAQELPFSGNSAAVFAEATQTIPAPQWARPIIILPPPILAFKPAEVPETNLEPVAKVVPDEVVELVVTPDVVNKLKGDSLAESAPEEIKGERLEAVTESVPVENPPTEMRSHEDDDSAPPTIISIDFSQALVPPDDAALTNAAPLIEVAEIPPATPDVPAFEPQLVADEGGDGQTEIAENERPEPIVIPDLEVLPLQIEADEPLADAKTEIVDLPVEAPPSSIVFVAEGRFTDRPISISPAWTPAPEVAALNAVAPVSINPTVLEAEAKPEPSLMPEMPSVEVPVDFQTALDDSVAEEKKLSAEAKSESEKEVPERVGKIEVPLPNLKQALGETPDVPEEPSAADDAAGESDSTESTPAESEMDLTPLLSLPQLFEPSGSVDVLPPPALPLRRFDQDALQALFMTDEVLDLPRISRLAAQLPGVHACVIATRDQACTGGRLPEGFDLAALLGLAPRVGEAAGRMPIGALKHFTLYGEQYSVSFFERNGLSLCAVHRPRSFVPGVREKLVAIADELSK